MEIKLLGALDYNKIEALLEKKIKRRDTPHINHTPERKRQKASYSAGSEALHIKNVKKQSYARYFT